MPGCIRRRKGKKGISWELRYYIEDLATGRRRVKTRTVKGSRRDAERELRNTQAEIDRGEYAPSQNMTFGELLARWFQEYAITQTEANTRNGYDRMIGNHLVPAFGRYMADRLTKDEVLRFYRKAEQSGNRKTQGGLSNQTILHLHRLLKQVFAWAVEQGIVRVNPLNGVRPPKARRSQKLQVLTEDQLARLLASCKGSEWEMPILLAALSGMRQGEILGLKWDCVSFGDNTITVNRSTEILDGRIALKDSPKTSKSHRTIAVSNSLMQALATHRERQALRHLEIGNQWQDNDLVCCRADGSFIHGSNLTIGFQRLLKKAGIPLVSYHALRHTHASLLLKAGVDLFVVSRRLGHSSIRITADVYGHLLPGQQETAVNALDRMLAPMEPSRTA